MRCTVCQAAIAESEQPERMVFESPNGQTYHIHDRCWSRAGLGEIEWPEVPLAFYRARQEPNIWAALEKLDDLVYGTRDTTLVGGAIDRLIDEYDDASIY